MRNFILGVIITLLVLGLGGLGFALLGFMPTHCHAAPSPLERRIALAALDASIERNAPRVSNPVPPLDQNLMDGMKLYTMNCAVCHGGLDKKEASLARSFYPPAPQLILDPPDDPEWHVYYAVRTGIRYTGMPAWNKTLSEDEMWKVTAFLSRIEKLPPAVQDFWKKSIAVPEPPAAPPERQEKGKKK